MLLFGSCHRNWSKYRSCRLLVAQCVTNCNQANWSLRLIQVCIHLILHPFLRPFTSFSHIQVVINALFAAIPGIGNVLVVSVLFWLIFSILGVQLFSGKFQACVDRDFERLSASIVPNKTECLRLPEKYIWVNADVNFDNVLNGFLALFQVVSS